MILSIRFGVPIAAKSDQSEITDNLIGAHTRRVVWIVDEATSAPGAIFDAWSNLAGGTEHRRLVMLGNPDDELDTLGRFCRPEAGWETVNADTEEWNFQYESEAGVALHFDGEKSPNLSHPAGEDGSSRWPFLFGHFDMERHGVNREQNPLAFWRFCRGWFADTSIVPKVLTMTEIDKYHCRDGVVFVGGTENFAALDPAFGGDRPILKIFKKGEDADTGRPCMLQVKTYEIPIPHNELVGKSIGSFVIEKSRDKELGFGVVGIDTTTDNSAPAEYIKLNSELEVIDVPFGGAPTDDPVSPTDRTRCREKYDRFVTELWFNVKQALPQVRGIDVETCRELCSRYYERVGQPEKLRVETKRELKARTGGKSPDLADAFAIGVFVFKRLGGFDLPGSRRDTTAQWREFARKRNGVFRSEGFYGIE